MRLSSETTAVVLDSTADLPDPSGRHPNWRVVPLYVQFGDETLRDYADLTPAAFYARLTASAAQPKTSQPTPADFAAVFAELSDCERILCLCLSEKLSGTAKSARIAAEGEGDRVRVIDTRTISGGTVILADAIQRRLDAGTTDEEIDELVDRFSREAHILFTVDTLDFLVRGGRIGKASGFAGELLSVKPILAIRDGEVEPVKRVRGRAKALAELERLFVEGTDDGEGFHAGVAHADAPEDGEDLAARVRRARPNASLDVFGELGPVIGAHGGPGTLGLFWFRD